MIEGLPERTLTLNGYTYFDGMGRTYLAKTDGPNGKTIRMETLFDDLGRVWKQSNPYYCPPAGPCDPVYYTVSTYDGLSRVTTVEKPDKPSERPNGPGYRITTEYQGLTKIVSKEYADNQWRKTSNTYDLNQKLVKVGEGIGVSGQETYTEYKYDVLGNLVQVHAAMDASGNDIYPTPENPTPIITTMTYDSLMKKIAMSDPDMGSWAYRYDKFGNLVLQIDAKSQAMAFEYDGLNRVTHKHYCLTYALDPPTCTSMEHSIDFAYDALSVPYSKGKLTSVSDVQNGNYDYVAEYDLFQRAKRSQKTIGAESATFEKTYDSAGRVVSIKYLAGTEYEKVYNYEYDVSGNLLYVQESGSAYPLVEYSEFTALGQPQFATFPKSPTLSAKTSYTYYPDTGRLHTLVTEKIVNGQVEETYQDLIYEKADGSSGYDGVGNILELADGLNLITHHYTYDHLNRLTLANGVSNNNPYIKTYTYDRIGNITYKTGVGSYGYGDYSRPHQVQSAGVFSFTYDANGNMTSRTGGGDAISIPAENWNYDNKPTSITKGTTTVTFTYDGNGQRVKKVSTGQVTRTTYYFDELYESREGVGDFIHVFAGNRRVATIPVGAGCNRFYHPNHLGSAAVVTGDDGQWVEKIEYFPFGSYRDRQDGDGACPNVNYTFTDQEDDDELGLYNYGARLYDPVLGKFISPDTIVQAQDDPQTLNRYSYARNNPIIYTDPSGNFFILDDIVVIISDVHL